MSKPLPVPTAAALPAGDPLKEAGVAHLINAYRVRGHTIANIDPLGSTRPMHPDLDPATHGLTIWDLDRRVVSQGKKLLREVLAECARRTRRVSARNICTSRSLTRKTGSGIGWNRRAILWPLETEDTPPDSGPAARSGATGTVPAHALYW